MRVYRYLCEGELKAILDGDMTKVGTSRVNNRSNSHHYKQGVKYLHFFKNIDDLSEIRGIKNLSEDNYYVGLFDIPFTTLIMNRGKGYYEGRGYDIDHAVVTEYAIPAEKIKPEYLVYYMQDPKREVTKEEVKSEISLQDSKGMQNIRPQEIGTRPEQKQEKTSYMQNVEEIAIDTSIFQSAWTTKTASSQPKTEDICQ